MNWNLLKNTPPKVKIDYSSDWFERYSEMNLWELYDDFHYENGFEDDAFFIKLLIKLKPSFEIPFSEIRPFSSSHLYCITKDSVKVFLSTIEPKELGFYYRKMIDVLSESYVNFLFDLIKQGKIRDSIEYYKKGIHNICEDCLHALIYDSATGVEFISNNEVFKIADKKSIFFDIIDETIKPEYFRGRYFYLCNRSPHGTISKWYEIAIKHTIFKLSNLNIDDKIALIPVLKENLFSEQNLKLAKGFNYSGIDGLEDFYKTFLERFEKEEKRKLEKQKEDLVKINKYYFKIGVKADNQKQVIEKQNQLCRVFKELQKGMKFYGEYYFIDFKSLYDTKVNYIEKFDWQGDIRELVGVFEFLKAKEVISPFEIWKTVKNRFLINGEEINKPKEKLADICRNVNLNPKSELYRILNSCL